MKKNEAQNVQQAQQQSKEIISSSLVNQNTTYAQAFLNKNSPSTESKSPDGFNEMLEMKDMMKQLLQQVSNMMNMITVLLSKLNEQSK